MLNLDTRIPLQVQDRDYGRGFDTMQQSQMNQLKLQALRDEYNAAKEEKIRQKQIRQGMASELQKLQQGPPAQYNTTFPQTMPTGQMPQGMTGVLASERGQNMPQPALFGENILEGNFDINREMVSPAVAGRIPDLKDYLDIQLKTAIANQDPDLAFDAFKKLKELEKNPAKYFQGLTEAVDLVTKQPILLAMTETGAVPSGYAPKPKDAKAVPVMKNGKPVTVPVQGTNEVKILMSDGTLMSGGSIPTPKSSQQDRPQQYFANDGLTGESFLETLPAQDKARVKAILRGDMPFPSTMAIRRDPNMARFAEAVFKADPSYTDMGYTNKKTSAKAFLPGQKLGSLILSNASARGHMDVLQEVYDAMQNGDIKKLNAFANQYRVQTGSAPEATFDAIKGVIGSEIMKSIVPGGGGVVEREEIRETLSRGYSPEQFMSVLSGYRALMQEQYDNMHQDYQRMGLPEKQWPTYLSHKEKVEKHNKEAQGGDGKDPYKITKGMNPKYVDYLMAHKELVRMKDFEGANMLTEMYKRGAK